ncbi:MAG: alanine--tRNA ligase [Planctomycetes bacterium GWF2_42_9]|nr:MAG: alanine--tRNA ligase [Planctomycetes bacterium GWF2_42_9]
MLTAAQIRKSFIDFFIEKKHTFVPSSPVVPIGDDTLLFANAGMNQFKDVFLGTGSREYNRAANTQKCIRAGGKHNDLEDVGTDTYHHTFFEMLGNWSFGDYFKAEAIEWAWELLTQRWGIDPTRLHATYFQGDESEGLAPDDEARNFWLRFLPDERIHKGNKKDNFWEMGETGPCGPCSEIHYDGTPDKSGAPFINKDNPNVIEIWNLVFMQFNRDSSGKLSALPAKHVDTGMGLERITRILQGKNSNYDTDLFTQILNAIGILCNQEYQGTMEKRDIAFRVISDHLRTLVFAITDGCMPSNDGRGYVLRRILRRAARFGRTLDMHEPFIYRLVDVVINLMGHAFEEIKQKGELVKTVIRSEEESFGRTLDRGLEIFADAAEKAKATNVISGQDAFQLYDTFGFPLDLTQLMAREQNLKVDTEGFDKLMEEQRQRARAAQKSSGFGQVVTDQQIPTTDDNAKYDRESLRTKIVGFVNQSGFASSGELTVGAEAAVVLEKSCFYAESGGQVGDKGIIKSPEGFFEVETTEKLAGSIIHKGKLKSGTMKVGDEVDAAVDQSRQQSRRNHTATHILQWALQQVMGNTVAQQGSLVAPEYLRFDFTTPRALKPEEVQEVEKLVNEKIRQSLPVTSVVMPIDEAKKLGAMALFNEKYGDTVRVIAIGAPDAQNISQAFSREFCGGTHIDNTGKIVGLKIIKEESISAGVRRITALTGNGLLDYYAQRSEVVEQLCQMLKAKPEELPVRLTKLIDENKKLAKQLKAAPAQNGTNFLDKARQLLESAECIGSVTVVVGKIETTPIDQVRTAIDMIKQKAGTAVIVFGMAEGDDKVTLLAGVTDDLAKNLKAGDIVKEIAPIVAGAGGGRPQLAQAGGKDPSKIDDALARATEIIKSHLRK